MTSVVLDTFDGFPTRALIAAPTAASSNDTTVLLVAPATGVPARFYGAFASWAAETYRIIVLTVEVRYVGSSFPDGIDLKDPEAKKAALIGGKLTTIEHHWLADIRAGLQYVRKTYPGSRILYLGHSVGAQMFPMISPERDWCSSVLFVANVVPYNGYFPDEAATRQNVADLVKRTLHLGYYPASESRMGDDIPQGVGLDWLRWRGFPQYCAYEYRDMHNSYRGRILSLGWADDWLVSRQRMDALLHCLPNAHVTRVIVDPLLQSPAWPAAGHVDMFKPKHRDTAWPMMMRWLLDQELPTIKCDIWDNKAGEEGYLRNKPPSLVVAAVDAKL